MPKGIYPIEKRKGMFQKGYDKRRTGFKKGHPQFNTGRTYFKKGQVAGNKNPFYGKKHTKEAIEKIRKANLGKKSSIETRKKLKGRKNHFYIDGRCNDKKKYNREWMKKFRKIPKNKIDGSISGNIWHSLKEKKNGRHWEDLVGYTLQDLMKHLENLFDENMNWENYGSYWEIDHKTPKSWFRYEIAEDLEFKKCWALENLQPLEISLNRSKKNYYEEIVVKV